MKLLVKYSGISKIIGYVLSLELWIFETIFNTLNKFSGLKIFELKKPKNMKYSKGGYGEDYLWKGNVVQTISFGLRPNH